MRVPVAAGPAYLNAGELYPQDSVHLRHAGRWLCSLQTFAPKGANGHIDKNRLAVKKAIKKKKKGGALHAKKRLTYGLWS